MNLILRFIFLTIKQVNVFILFYTAINIDLTGIFRKVLQDFIV
jgi:hypothetical protein